MIKTIAKILLAIAILWTLAFVFKLGNSFALSPEYKKEIYNNCYQDAKLSLGAKRAKQYCTCTTTMLDNKYSDEDILSIGQKSEAEQIRAFAFASNHCNKNANAPSSENSNQSENKLLKLSCLASDNTMTTTVVIDTSKLPYKATVQGYSAKLDITPDMYLMQYRMYDGPPDITFSIDRNTGNYSEVWIGSETIYGNGSCQVAKQKF